MGCTPSSTFDHAERNYEPPANTLRDGGPKENKAALLFCPPLRKQDGSGRGSNRNRPVQRPIETPQSSRIPIFEDHYIQGKQLGFGAFAVVFVAQHKETKVEYAVKKIDRSKMYWGDRDALDDEISNLKALRDGPHIVKLYEDFYTQQNCFLVMEIMQGGELFDRIIEKTSYTEAEARAVTRCMLEALKYMHSKRIVHRDLKPENLLLQTKEMDTNIKLADFGFAKKVLLYNGCRTLCGTPGYLAPEILERWPAYDTKCDLWSVGVILYLLLGGCLPFDDDSEEKVFDQTRNGKYEFHPQFFGGVSNEAKELVTFFLTINPSKRYSANRGLEHKWMQAGDEELQNPLIATEEAKKKLRAAAKTMVALNRLKDLEIGFQGYLEKAKRENERYTSIHPVRPKKADFLEKDDSKSGQPFANFYEVGEALGKGGFAMVNRARHRKTGMEYAVKDIEIARLDPSMHKALRGEISALRLLRGGPHIVRLHDAFEEPEHVYMVMEEMKGGELLQRIVEKEVYTEREARQTTKILFEAIDYCHKKRIAHRDIKPENLLLVEKNDDTSIKIADFGFAKKVTKKNGLKTLCGTVAYIAPEVLKPEGYDERADMWSIGVVIYILLGGYAPFEGTNEELAHIIRKGEYEFHDEYWSHISQGAKDLVSSLLQVNPDMRITAEEALQCEWMVAEEETLTVKDLSVAQSQIRSKALPGVEKLRGVLKAMIATNKLTASLKLALSRDGTRRYSAIAEENSSQFSVAEDAGVLVDGVLEENSSGGKPFQQLYERIVEPGADGFSIIYNAKHKQSEKEYTVKFFPRKDLHPSDAVALQDEISALKALQDCEYIVNLHDVFEEPDNLYIVFERTHGGDLIDRIIERAHYTEGDAKAVMKQLLTAVEYCHSKRIAHRNLKPENLLLVSRESDTDVRISDFGYAKKVLYPNSLRTQCGTEGYVAPEILSHAPWYDVSCDMWSMGVVLYVILGGYRPFRGTTEDVMKQTRYGEYDFHQKYWGHVSHEAKDLIKSMLTVDPESRITATDALKSQWIVGDVQGKKDLVANRDALASFKRKEQLKKVVNMIIATNKLQSLGSQYF